MQSPESDAGETAWVRVGQGGASSLINGVEFAEQDVIDFIDARGPAEATWDMILEGDLPGGNATGMFWRDEATGNGAPDDGDWWFVAGGKSDGNDLTAVNAPSATMDPNAGAAVEWLPT
jgi:hypothetical protein